MIVLDAVTSRDRGCAAQKMFKPLRGASMFKSPGL
jgi:hypothetical protein